MNAELRKDPDTEGPLFYRDPMQGTSYIETEMSMTPYTRNCPLLCPHTHTHHYYPANTENKREIGHATHSGQE